VEHENFEKVIRTSGSLGCQENDEFKIPLTKNLMAADAGKGHRFSMVFLHIYLNGWRSFTEACFTSYLVRLSSWWFQT
jgi:hypothetical protein